MKALAFFLFVSVALARIKFKQEPTTTYTDVPVPVPDVGWYSASALPSFQSPVTLTCYGEGKVTAYRMDASEITVNQKISITVESTAFTPFIQITKGYDYENSYCVGYAEDWYSEGHVTYEFMLESYYVYWITVSSISYHTNTPAPEPTPDPTPMPIPVPMPYWVNDEGRDGPNNQDRPRVAAMTTASPSIPALSFTMTITPITPDVCDTRDIASLYDWSYTTGYTGDTVPSDSQCWQGTYGKWYQYYVPWDVQTISLNVCADNSYDSYNSGQLYFTTVEWLCSDYLYTNDAPPQPMTMPAPAPFEKPEALPRVPLDQQRQQQQKRTINPNAYCLAYQTVDNNNCQYITLWVSSSQTYYFYLGSDEPNYGFTIYLEPEYMYSSDHHDDDFGWGFFTGFMCGIVFIGAIVCCATVCCYCRHKRRMCRATATYQPVPAVVTATTPQVPLPQINMTINQATDEKQTTPAVPLPTLQQPQQAQPQPQQQQVMMYPMIYLPQQFQGEPQPYSN